MRIGVLERLQRVKRDIVNSQPIAKLPWSAIRRIGQSRLLALTIVVPFLGSLILFNQHVVELLTLSPELVRRWKNFAPSVAADDAARQLTLSRLYCVYFGLTFLGIGSALFSLFCPLIVKSYASAVEYIQVEGRLVTKSRMGLIVTEVAQHYLSWSWDDDAPAMPELLRRLGEPTDFTTLGAVSITEIFSDTPAEELDEETASAEEVSLTSAETVGEAPVPQYEESPFEDDPIYDRRGRPDSTKIAKILYYRLRPYQGMVEEFCEEANKDKHRNDMFTLRYMALDNTRPNLRVAVSACYGLGFALLLIPTVVTFVQVVRHLVL